MIFRCCSAARAAQVLAYNADPANTNAAHFAPINGIGFLEVLDREAPAGVAPQQTLVVHCLIEVAGLGVQNVFIDGGSSITGITAAWVARPGDAAVSSQAWAEYFATLDDTPNILVVGVSKVGDFSTYRLRLVQDRAQAAASPFDVTQVLPGFDPQLAEVAFSFKVECGQAFDCAPPAATCPPAPAPPPPINYLAKDFGSFRTVILDRLNQLLPGRTSANEADFGVMLAELIAYVGDSLSYQQDAVATEAYIGTARRRVSLRRHARLVDYLVSDGCNARVWMQLAVAGAPGVPIVLARGETRFFTQAPGMPVSLAVGAGNAAAAAAIAAGAQVFEPLSDALLYSEHNLLLFYTWGEAQCCLPRGATRATLAGSLVRLRPGDVLIFEEVLGPLTGASADADPRHRCAVRLTSIATLDAQGEVLCDPLTGPPGAGAPVTEIAWASEDALPFALCVSSSFSSAAGGTVNVANVSVARGNVVLADHGLTFTAVGLGTVPAPILRYAPGPAADRCQPEAASAVPVRFMPTIPGSPLTQAQPIATVSQPPAGFAAAALAISTTVPTPLIDTAGQELLLLQSRDPGSWPGYFGVAVRLSSGQAQAFDLVVEYLPADSSAPVVVESYSDLTWATLASRTAASQLVAVSPAAAPPATLDLPAAFPADPLVLAPAGAISVTDAQGRVLLSVSPLDASQWPARLGVLVQTDQGDQTTFDLEVLYQPSGGGVGVSLPVVLERFAALTPTLAISQLSLFSHLVSAAPPQGGGSGLIALDPGLSAFAALATSTTGAVPEIGLTGTLDAIPTAWTPVRDLLESDDEDAAFVVEVESDGTASVRFGDDVNGRSPDAGTVFTASYRIGNGTAGNVGADSLVRFATAPLAAAAIQTCRNPLPAVGGQDPETSDQIRRRAPFGFLAQERAVTMADYEAMAEADPVVDQAVASLRWTGSWYTVFIAVQPQGAELLSASQATRLTALMDRYRLAGQDLELDSPQYVSLEITLLVCVDPAYLRSDVETALTQVLGSTMQADGQPGLFAPDQFTFGQAVYLSPIYVAARGVAGVTSVRATVFQPQGSAANDYLATGRIPLGPLQIARLDNDPNHPDHGVLRLRMTGGR